MASGLELMLTSMMKNMGIDPLEIIAVVQGIGAGVKRIDEQQGQIIAQQRVIMDQLGRAGFGPVMLPQSEDIEDGDGTRNGTGNGSGSADGRGDGEHGTDGGS